MKKTTLILICIAIFTLLFLYLYRELRPTIVFHSPVESCYLGKVSRIDGSIDKLYIKNHKIKYKLPHVWCWNENDEIAIFTNKFCELYTKENINFRRTDIYLDEDKCYVSHSKKRYFWTKSSSKK